MRTATRTCIAELFIGFLSLSLSTKQGDCHQEKCSGVGFVVYKQVWFQKLLRTYMLIELDSDFELFKKDDSPDVENVKYLNCFKLIWMPRVSIAAILLLT